MTSTDKYGYRAIALFALLGILLSGFSVYEHMLFQAGSESASALCNISSTVNCVGAMKSQWSEVFGLPLGTYGLAFYLSLFFLALVLPSWAPRSRERATSLLALLSLFSVIASVFLFYISKVHIGSICPVCFGLYLISLLVFIAFMLVERELGGLSRFFLGIRELFLLPKTVLVDWRNREGAANTVTLRTSLLLLLFGAAAYGYPALLHELVIVRGIGHGGADLRKQVQNATNSWHRQPTVEIPRDMSPGPMQDYIKGNPNAPVRLVEFFDFECPACRVFFFDLQELAEAFPSELSIEYRNYPLDHTCNPSIGRLFHRNACFAAKYARCAGEQGKFFETLAHLMTLPAIDDETSSPREIRRAIKSSATRLGLDRQAIERCLVSDHQIKKIRNDIAVADQLGLQATPSVWVNGKPVDDLSFEALERIIQEILNGEGRE